MQKLNSFLSLVVALLLSCNGQNTTTNPQSIKSDTTRVFKKEIAAKENRAVNLFYNLKIKKESQLNLESLESGYDSLQIRIWYDYALLNNRDLIIIKETHGNWSAETYEMTAAWDAVKLTDSITSKKIKSAKPKSGWDDFIKKLFALNIMTLPNMDDIPGLVDNWTDGVTYNVEVATKRLYRFYEYHLPDKFQDKFWQARNMVEILDLIRTEFKV